MNERRRALAALATTLLLASPARAGPPYVDDDPEPTRTGGWENYVFVSGANTPGETVGETGVELNYAGAKDLQLSLDLPLAFDSATSLRAGGGEVQASVKYRFIHQAEGSWAPDLAVFPAVTLPTGASAFHTGHISWFLPVWAQKDFGKWSVFGGGGVAINPGGGQCTFTLSGVALTRSVGKRLNLGIEVYHETPQAIGGAALTNLGLGAIYQLTRRWALMASGGPGLQSPGRAEHSAFYASLQFTN